MLKSQQNKGGMGVAGGVCVCGGVLVNGFLPIKGKYTYLMRLKWSHLHLLLGCLHNVRAALIISSHTAGEKQRDAERVSKSPPISESQHFVPAFTNNTQWE